MPLLSYFQHIKSTKTLPDGKVFCFFIHHSPYPLLFFQHLIGFFKRNGISIESIDSSIDISLIKNMLSTVNFYGQAIYWLEGFCAQTEKKQHELLLYLSTYDGPHRILLCSHLAEKFLCTLKKNVITTIDLSKSIRYDDILFVRFLVSDLLPEKSNFVSQLTMYSDYLSLDNLCLLAHYERVLGKNSDEFFMRWAAPIIDPASSLFVLSQCLFNKNKKQFFRYWSIIFEQYPATFWIHFWADQVWRSYIYCDLMRQKKYAEAKKAQYKLPFSFINRDWVHYELNELRNAHQFLAMIDFKLKNGGSELGLEYFYCQFFESAFS